MQPGVMADGVAFSGDPSHQVRMFQCGLADQEERRAHAFVRQCGKHLRRRRRPRAVIERQYDLVIPKRQRFREVFQPHLGRGGGIDFQNTRGTERSLARTVRRLGRRHPAKQAGEANRGRVRELPTPFPAAHLYHCAK